jgi:D-cysteine desulfhydrase
MITNIIGDNIWVLRDDLYPSLGGGNKGRKMDEIAKKIVKGNYNAVVTTGGIQSNHCRAVAIYAVQHKLDCTLVIHGDEHQFRHQSGNAKIIRDSKVNLIFCEPNVIASRMDEAISYYRKKGKNPYYLYGGGHTVEGAKAYTDATVEFLNTNSFIPDYIFLASGTGSTQSGIMAGLDQFNLKTEVIGVSVARTSDRAESIVNKLYKEVCKKLKISCSNRKSIVLDDYLYGGYQHFNEGIRQLSEASLSKYGFPLDTTYTGKAFYGMLDYIETKKIEGNILFWHTGGLLNYLA